MRPPHQRATFAAEVCSFRANSAWRPSWQQPDERFARILEGCGHEGIGQGRITANLEGFTPDFSYRIPDAEALPLVFEMLEDEGICLGGSSGINIAGAIRMAQDMGPGKTIVTILCDYGNRYQSKLYNPAFLKEKGLPVPEWLDRAPAVIPTVFEDA